MKRVLIVLMLLLMLIGCGESGKSNINYTANGRLVIVETSTSYMIIVDKETKVMYVHFYRGGGTIMVDENGNPLRWEGKLK